MDGDISRDLHESTMDFSSKTPNDSTISLDSISGGSLQLGFDLGETKSKEELRFLDEQNRIAQIEAKKKGLEIRKEIRRIRDNDERRYFSLNEKGELLYYGQTIDNNVVDWVRDIYDKHYIPPTSRTAVLDSFIYAAISGATSLEDNSKQYKIIKNKFKEGYPEDESKIWELFSNLGNINGNSQKLHIQGRYDSKRNPFVTCGQLARSLGGYEVMAREYFAHPHEFRVEMTKSVYGVSYKVASFFYLMMGGHDLMTLDSKNCRQLSGLGNNIFGIKERNAFSYINSNRNRRKPEPPSPKQYIRIEKEVMDYFSDMSQFFHNGKISGNYLTDLFWGADIRGRKLGQLKTRTQDIFELGSSPHEIMPDFR